MSSIRIGDFRITLIRAGSYWWDGGAMFGVVPKTLWSKQQPCDDLNRIEAGFNCFVIEHGSERILVETGGGVRHDDRSRERMRFPHPPDLRAVLATAGFEPESFTTVINTHLHWDHVGGNTFDGAGGVFPSLPNARYLTQRGELEHAREQHPRDAVSYRPSNYDPLLEDGHLQLLDGDCEIAPGVELRVVPGHNRDMMVVLVRSRAETWCHFADLIPYASQLSPTWVSGFDLFPLQTIAGKIRILEEAANGNWWCSFGHDPSVAFAKIGFEREKWQIRQKQA